MKRDLIPREPKRMRQPRKEVLRDQLALAADEIIRLRQRLAPFEFVEPIVRASATRHSHTPSARNPPPPPTPPRDVTGAKGPGSWVVVENPRPWWRRIFRSTTRD